MKEDNLKTRKASIEGDNNAIGDKNIINHNTYIVNLSIHKAESIELEILKFILVERAKRIEAKKKLLEFFIKTIYYEKRGSRKKAKREKY